MCEVRPIPTGLLLLLGVAVAEAVVLPLSTETLTSRAAAVCRATVIGNRCFRSGNETGIYTETYLAVDEVFKGSFADVVRIVERGGRLDGSGEAEGDAPRYMRGESRLLYIARAADGSLRALDGHAGAPILAAPAAATRDTAPATADHALDALRALTPDGPLPGADVSDQRPLSPDALNGLFPGTTGDSYRFTQPDRGEPIGYLVDMDALPPGITPAVALAAVSNAFQAWQSVCSVAFEFQGIESFGKAAANVVVSDGRIRVQLHDLYGYVSGAGTLGRGGASFSYDNALFPNGGLGGRVGSAAFDITRRGYVVLEHTQPALSNAKTLEEVTCHEIGHTLSMDHSSEAYPETDPTLAGAIMYYMAHADGRGAALASWDIATLRRSFPLANTPPYAYDRDMYIVTATPQWSAPGGVNSISLPAYDLQGGSLSLVAEYATSRYGTFAYTGTTITYTPTGLYNGPPLDPASGSYYDMACVTVSDGVNRSPPVDVMVLSMSSDAYPRDGLPDAWATLYGVRNANDDPDKDGIPNYWEWLHDTDPTRKDSSLRIESFANGYLTWRARPYEVYELKVAPAPDGPYVRQGNPCTPTTPVGSVSVGAAELTRRFYRIQKVR